MTTHWDAPPEEAWAIAQRLGLSACRRFTRWCDLQPGPDLYRLDDLSTELDTAKKYGIDVWLCVVRTAALRIPGQGGPDQLSRLRLRWGCVAGVCQNGHDAAKGQVLRLGMAQ